jgi:hypothetical protein
MKDLPYAHARHRRRRRPVRGKSDLGLNIPFKRLRVFAWSDDRPFPVFSLITVAHFA